VSIDQHTDVQRMLLSMKSQVQAGRALTYAAALALDSGDAHKVDILTPLVKSWCTDMACEVTSIGVQVHGGMGYIEETGAAQFYRDARILPIYEGTNGIQALDLAFRKTLRDGGASVSAYINELRGACSKDLATYFEMLEKATEALLETGQKNNLDLAGAMAGPYLKGFALIAAGALLEKSIIELEGRADTFANEKRRTIHFYLGNILPMAKAHLEASMNSSSVLVE